MRELSGAPRRYFLPALLAALLVSVLAAPARGAGEGYLLPWPQAATQAGAAPQPALSQDADILPDPSRPLPPGVSAETIRRLARSGTLPGALPPGGGTAIHSGTGPAAASPGMGTPPPGGTFGPLTGPDNATLPQAGQRSLSSEPISLPDAPPSPMERVYRERYQSPLAAGLTQFGYDAVRPARSAGAEAAPIAPGPGYVLGPGDVLRLHVRSTDGDFQTRAEVDRDGRISIPRLGDFRVAGLAYGQVEQALTADGRSALRGLDVSASLERLRDVPVYVVGAVAQPGLRLVPAGASVLDALALAGGPTKPGSLRQVRLTRTGQPERVVDLYGLLLHGRRDADLFVHERDVIFVPPLGPTAAVTGAAGRPGIYELSGPATLAELLAMAGGALPQGAAAHLTLRRFDSGRAFAVQELNLSDPAAAARVAITDGDLVEIATLPAAFPATVTLEGHVWQPRTLAWTPELRLTDLFPSPDVLKPDAVTDFGLILRYDNATTRTVALAFPLARVLAGQHDEPLMAHDRVRVASRAELAMEEPVVLGGGVWREGNYTYAPGLTLGALVALGGGLKFGADPERIELARTEIVDGRAATRLLTLSLSRDRDLALAPFDAVRVPLAGGAGTFRQVRILGEVKYPGVYRLAQGEKLSDLIVRAGGTTPEAYFFGAKYTSARAREVQQQSLDRLVRELELGMNRALAEQAQDAASPEETEGAKAAAAGLDRLLARMREVKAQGRVSVTLTELSSFAGSRYDFAPEDGDALEIPRVPAFVSVVGAVYSPSSYLYQPETTCADYLEKSGGPTRVADEDSLYVLRANGEVVSRRQVGRSRFDDLALMPGDTVVAPENFDRVPYFRLVKGMTDIIFKIATTAGIAIAIL